MSRRAIAADVTRPATIGRMALVQRVVKLAAAALAFALYLWFAAVRYVPAAKARKARQRAR